MYLLLMIKILSIIDTDTEKNFLLRVKSWWWGWNPLFVRLSCQFCAKFGEE